MIDEILDFLDVMVMRSQWLDPLPRWNTAPYMGYAMRSDLFVVYMFQTGISRYRC